MLQHINYSLEYTIKNITFLHKILKSDNITIIYFNLKPPNNESNFYYFQKPIFYYT